MKSNLCTTILCCVNNHATNTEKRYTALLAVGIGTGLCQSRQTAAYDLCNEVGSNYIGSYVNNPAAVHLQMFGYNLQELVIDRPAKHKWEKVTNRTGKMPSVQLFLTKYPTFLPLQGTDPYSLESNFKMKELLALDEALPFKTSGSSTSQPIIDLVSKRMAFKSELSTMFSILDSTHRLLQSFFSYQITIQFPYTESEEVP